MNKNLVKLAIALFWGVNVIFLFFYGIVTSLRAFFRGKREKSDERTEYENQFWFVILIPILSLVVIFLAGDSTFNILFFSYSFLILFCAVIISFSKDAIELFAANQEEKLSSYLEFGIFLACDGIFAFILLLLLSIFTSLWVHVIVAAIIVLSMVFFFFKFQRTYRHEKKIIINQEKTEKLLLFYASRIDQMEHNFHELEDLYKAAVTSDIDLAIRILGVLLDKRQRFLTDETIKLDKHRINLLKGKIQTGKTQQYQLQEKLFLQTEKAILAEIKKKKVIDAADPEFSKKKQQGYRKLVKLAEIQLNQAKKNRNVKDIQRYTEKIQFYSKEAE